MFNRQEWWKKYYKNNCKKISKKCKQYYRDNLHEGNVTKILCKDKDCAEYRTNACHGLKNCEY